MATQLVNRTYIFDDIIDNLRPLTVISAPEGFGKTILAQQLVELFKYPVAWHNLDIWQKDMVYLHENCRRVFGAIGLHIPERYSSESKTAQDMTSAIRANPDQSYFYVLDDVQYLHNSIASEKWLQSLIDMIPPNLHIILLGRSLPVIDWYQSIGRGLVYYVDKSKLAFTPDDVMKMASLERQQAEALVAEYSGWITAIRLVLDSSYRETVGDLLKSETPETSVFHELIKRFFEAQATTVQQSLLTSSTSKEITLSICQNIYEQPQIYLQLERLSDSHLLVTKTEQGYRLHDLLREFLQDQFRTVDQTRFHYLHLRLAQWYEEQNEFIDAIIHYIEANATMQAVQLAENVAKELHANGQWNTLIRLNELLAGRDVPRLCLITSLVLTDTNRLDDSDELLARAEYLYQKRGDEENITRVTLQRAFNKLLRGKYELGLRTIRHLQSKSLSPLLEAWYHRIIGRAKLGLGAYEEAITALLRTKEIYSSHATPNAQIQILQDLAYAYIQSGRFEEATVALQDLIALCRLDGNSITHALALNNLASIFHITSQYDNAIATFEKAKSLLPDFTSSTTGYIYHGLGDLYRDLDNVEASTYDYRVAYQIGKSGNFSILRDVVMSQCRVALWNKQLYEAQVLLQDISAPALIQSIDDTLIHIWYEIVALWENPKSYNPINLSNYLERLDTVNATRQMSTLLGSVIYLAKVNQLDSLLEVSTNILSRFSEAYLHPIAVDCYHLPRLRKYLQSIDVWTVIEPIYRKLTDSIVSQITLRDTNKLELIMLGCDVVIWQGVALQDTSWVSPQARELFYCLYFFGAQNKSQLARRLWNDHSDYQVRNSLRAAKQRLDDTLPNVIVYQNDAYRFNPEIKVKSDVVLFEETVRSAGRLLARDARAEELYLRAISMYNELGLLPTLFGDWIQPLRDKYERLYRQALEGATKCYIARNDFTGTIMLLESQLSIDPYDESVYQSLMSCHAKNKQFAKVQLTFDRLTRVLATLDLIPQSETVQLLNLLLI